MYVGSERELGGFRSIVIMLREIKKLLELRGKAPVLACIIKGRKFGRHSKADISTSRR